jgi:H+/Cl- antiporter ClcA
MSSAIQLGKKWWNASSEQWKTFLQDREEQSSSPRAIRSSAQTKAALFARGGRISFATVFGKFFCTSATLACGIPFGREGPAVQVGAGIASVLGHKLGLWPEKVKALLPIGAAAAIAAAFNTPLAAVLFALEEVLGESARAGAGVGRAGLRDLLGDASSAAGK